MGRNRSALGRDLEHLGDLYGERPKRRYILDK
jgi:hypothetical protein